MFVPGSASCSTRLPVRIHQYGDLLLAAEPDDLSARKRIDLDSLIGESLVVQAAPDLDAIRRERELIKDLLCHASRLAQALDFGHFRSRCWNASWSCLCISPRCAERASRPIGTLVSA